MTIKYLNTDQIYKALERAALNQKEFLIISVLAKTGIRVTELLNLTVQDCLMQQKQLIIRGKGKKIRNVDVPINLILQLSVFIKTNNLKTKDHLIPLTRQRIYQITKKIAEVNPHIFRHSYAIHLLRKTKNIRYVQIQLGHESLTTTQVYLRYMDYDEEKNKLEGLYSET